MRRIGRARVRTLLIVGLAATAICAVAAAAPAALAAQGGTPSASLVRQGMYRPLGGTAARPAAAANLVYQGGPHGIDPSPRVYLVFWGSQWNSDSLGVRAYLEGFFRGLGTASDQWSRVTTQYCDGVSRGATSCGSAGKHPAFTGAVYAGTWMDTANAAPHQASGTALGNEAAAAAAHFGNTGQAPNLNAQYIILSPSGTHPDGFGLAGANWCAWHSATGSRYGNLAFTNMPYVHDTGCATHAVNSGQRGELDGFSIVVGHEYAETVTDFLAGQGWLDSSGAENGDKCVGHNRNLTLPTGSFAVQSTWSNQISGCSFGS